MNVIDSSCTGSRQKPVTGAGSGGTQIVHASCMEHLQPYGYSPQSFTLHSYNPSVKILANYFI